MAGDLRERLLGTIRAQRGVVFARPAIVYRVTYTGQNIVAPNDENVPGKCDDRGCVGPVCLRLQGMGHPGWAQSACCSLSALPCCSLSCS